MNNPQIFSKRWFRELGSVKLTPLETTTRSDPDVSFLASTEERPYQNHVYYDGVDIDIDKLRVEMTPTPEGIQNVWCEGLVPVSKMLVPHVENGVYTYNLYFNHKEFMDKTGEHGSTVYLTVYFTDDHEVTQSYNVQVQVYFESDWYEINGEWEEPTPLPYYKSSAIRLANYDMPEFPKAEWEIYNEELGENGYTLQPNTTLCMSLTIDTNTDTIGVRLVGENDGVVEVLSERQKTTAVVEFPENYVPRSAVASVEYYGWGVGDAVPGVDKTIVEFYPLPEKEFAGFPASNFGVVTNLSASVPNIRNRMCKLQTEYTDKKGNVYPAGSYVIVSEEGEIKGSVTTRKHIQDLKGA